ncbi:hypothetical protein CI41S_67690 [Bradyrhizobium ivorense]|nr:hypothetical protein CI41S_67690 [Bradyrhizobium ivorense]
MVQLINLLATAGEGPCKPEEILDGSFDGFLGAFAGGCRGLDETLVFRGGRMIGRVAPFQDSGVTMLEKHFKREAYLLVALVCCLGMCKKRMVIQRCNCLSAGFERFRQPVKSLVISLGGLGYPRSTRSSCLDGAVDQACILFGEKGVLQLIRLTLLSQRAQCRKQTLRLLAAHDGARFCCPSSKLNGESYRSVRTVPRLSRSL